MNFSIKIDSRNNRAFYREADRAASLQEINESAGLKYLISREIDFAKRALAEKIIDGMEVTIEKDYDGYVVVIKEA